jgi:hypothetical protein
MKTSGGRFALALCGAAVMLAGCSADSQLAPGPITQNASRLSSRPALGRSWMAPDLNLKKKDLLYVSNFYGSNVLVFTYPGGKQVGTLTGVADAEGECTSSTSKGDWWVVASGAGEILEYAHGGTSPIATLSETAGEATACAVDSTTGNLAAAILGNGDVVIFADAKGMGTIVSTSLTEVFSDAYDSQGDLFVAGLNSGNAFALVKLRKGSSSFETVTLNETIEGGGLQWSGRDLVIGNGNELVRFRIHGTAGTLEGVTMLSGGSDLTAFWIQKPYIVAADAGNQDAAIWKYPAGGMPIKILTGVFDLPSGVVVSVAPQ